MMIVFMGGSLLGSMSLVQPTASPARRTNARPPCGADYADCALASHDHAELAWTRECARYLVVNGVMNDSATRAKRVARALTQA
jgi:hypothetical protein